MRTLAVAALAVICFAASSALAAPVANKDVVDAYEYLLSRQFVLRQQNLDFKDGMKWNEIVHRAPGGIARASPDLDVAYSEAWVAVDETSCTLVNVPAIKKRYYTIQVLNGWGEVTANINERNFPEHAFGVFALCLTGADVALPAGAERIDLAGKQARIISRIELGADANAAMSLQRRVTVRATGTPKIAPAPATPDFADGKLPGVEAFDHANAVLASAPDAPGTAALKTKARAVEAMIAASLAARARVDYVIRTQAKPHFLAAVQKVEVAKNAWSRPRAIGNRRNDYLMRSIANYAGIWANSQKEVVYVVADNLDGGTSYRMTFPAGELPASKVTYFWSVAAVDAEEIRVMDNPLNRYALNAQSGLRRNRDGSLTLAFGPIQPTDVPAANWLPTPKWQRYKLTFRFYGPSADVANGTYVLPPLRATPVMARPAA